MIVTLLWEDHLGTEVKSFGPHQLVIGCVADERGMDRYKLKSVIKSVPKKGNGNVIRALKNDLSLLLDTGPVLAIVDKDKAHKLWPNEKPPLTCFSGICRQIRKDIAGEFEFVLLVDNVETLVLEAAKLQGRAASFGKPTPDERDSILNKLAFDDNASLRTQLREVIPSFNRLVEKVLAVLPDALG